MVSEHGGNTFDYDIYFDFSVNLNPLGMPTNARQALVCIMSECEKYPDPFCRKLTEKLSVKENISTENIVCGNGASDLIFRIVQTLMPKKAIVLAPTFGEYEKALIQNKCKIIRHHLIEQNDFIPDSSLLDKLEDDIDMLFICNPNNPTGIIFENTLLEKIAERCIEKDIILVCDECFLDFVKDQESHSVRQFLNRNVIILKAFTKIYAMAGLRLGYAIFGDADIANKVKESGQYWSVSVPAQIAGEAAVFEYDYVKKTVELIEEERKFLIKELLRLGFKVYPSNANFIMFRCDIPLDRMLIKGNIMIRNCESYCGLEYGYFRVAVRSHRENEILISEIRWQRRCLNQS